MPENILQYEFISRLKKLSFVEEIWLFGSRARGDNKELSDVDLAIVCPKANDNDWLKVTEIIDSADTLLKIDCLRMDKDLIGQEIYQNILRDKKVIYVKTVSWQEYFYTLGNAISRLREVMEHPQLDENEYMRDAAIQRFEFTIELFWKLLKKVLFHEKIDTTTPRDTLSKAYQYELIGDEKTWLQMLDDRNNTSHAYREEEAKKIFENIKKYLPVFEQTYVFIQNKYGL